MVNLTFGEQVKIILSRKGMTIKELAELIEERTGKKMSRQNLTQRLGRDNFQEQDMRQIAEILGCPFQLSILGDSEVMEKPVKARAEKPSAEREVTIGDLVDLPEEKPEPVVKPRPVVKPEPIAKPEPIVNQRPIAKPEPIVNQRPIAKPEPVVRQEPAPEEKRRSMFKGFRKAGSSSEPETRKPIEKQQPVGEINPYTRREYETNSVRMHPKRIGYVQVYDQSEHKWTDMTEWAFLGYQERKKKLLGKDYVPPIYLD